MFLSEAVVVVMDGWSLFPVNVVFALWVLPHLIVLIDFDLFLWLMCHDLFVLFFLFIIWLQLRQLSNVTATIIILLVLIMDSNIMTNCQCVCCYRPFKLVSSVVLFRKRFNYCVICFVIRQMHPLQNIVDDTEWILLVACSVVVPVWDDVQLSHEILKLSDEV